GLAPLGVLPRLLGPRGRHLARARVRGGGRLAGEGRRAGAAVALAVAVAVALALGVGRGRRGRGGAGAGRGGLVVGAVGLPPRLERLGLGGPVRGDLARGRVGRGGGLAGERRWAAAR